MKLAYVIAAIGALFVAGLAHAADTIKLEITALEEQQGKLTVSLSATGPDGRPLSGLTAANFKTALDGTALPVENLQVGTTPQVSTGIVLLVDVSGSMRGEPMDQAKRALLEFVQAANGSDQIAVLAFDTRVTQLQDFTTDRNLLTQAINKLTPLGDTALYDAVIAGTAKAASLTTNRKIVVLLSDGQATVSQDKRAASLAAAKAGGFNIVSIGLGADIDRGYLNEIATGSGGRSLEAPTPAALRQAYLDLASSLRSLYTLTITVPPGVDRTVAAKLSVQASMRTDTGTVERVLNPLAGAVPPPFGLSINGLKPGQRLEQVTTLEPAPLPAGAYARVEYLIDGEVVLAATEAPFSYALDPALVAEGNHLIKVVATDARGRQGEAQLPFVAVAPSKSFQVPPEGIAFAALGLALLALGIFIMSRRHTPAESVASRVRPWAPQGVAPTGQPLIDWSTEQPSAAIPVDDNQILGRVVVMDEAAVRGGTLSGIREYPIGSSPLTLGSGSGCDVRIEDQQGRIATEEARLWVHRGRLVYHKLTTLSAMATEGVTAGWQIIESGEDVTLGPYRILFQADAPSFEDSPPVAPSPPVDQRAEQATSLRELWSHYSDEAGSFSASPE